MASLDEIIDRVREDAGADFAFVMTRRGRLATRNAPQAMPDTGRAAIMHLAEQLLQTRRAFAHMEIPREYLVPFGGAAPVDVYVAARDEAIVVVVMATFVQQNRVGPAVSQGIQEIEELLDTEGQRRLRRRGLKAKPPNPKSSQGAAPKRRTGTHALDFDDEGSSGKPREEEPAPEIIVTEARVGNVTLAAIEVDADSPDIAYGYATIGRNTVAEIERSDLPPGDPLSSIPDVRVTLVTMPELDVPERQEVTRNTLPFTENPAAAKRAFEAKVKANQDAVAQAAGPNRAVVVGRSSMAKISRRPQDEEDERREREHIQRSSRAETDTIPEIVLPKGGRKPTPPPGRKPTPPPGRRPTPPPGVGRTLLRDSNIDAWHRALDEVIQGPTDPAASETNASEKPEGKGSKRAPVQQSAPTATKRRTQQPPAPPKRRD